MSQELINLTKKVEVVMDLRKIPNVKAQVCLAIDYSGSMGTLYRNGTVQKTVNRLSAVAVKFDDNQELDVLVFHDGVHEAKPATPALFGTYVDQEIVRKFQMGGTNYAPFIEKAIENYFGSNVASSIIDGTKSIMGALAGAFGFGKKTVAPVSTTSNKSTSGFPIFCIVVTDGENSDKDKTTALLKQMGDKNIYWQFVGIGNERFTYLQKTADELPNVGFFKIDDIENIKDLELYKELLNEEFAAWVQKF